jgi:hypothetical protein
MNSGLNRLESKREQENRFLEEEKLKEIHKERPCDLRPSPLKERLKQIGHHCGNQEEISPFLK